MAVSAESAQIVNLDSAQIDLGDECISAHTIDRTTLEEARQIARDEENWDQAASAGRALAMDYALDSGRKSAERTIETAADAVADADRGNDTCLQAECRIVQTYLMMQNTGPRSKNYLDTLLAVGQRLLEVKQLTHSETGWVRRSYDGLSGYLYRETWMAIVKYSSSDDKYAAYESIRKMALGSWERAHKRNAGSYELGLAELSIAAALYEMGNYAQAGGFALVAHEHLTESDCVEVLPHVEELIQSLGAAA